jgi:hypothetical protein
MAIKTFTAGEVLTAADTNTYLANSGLTYITGGALSTATTDFVGCFSSTYTNYRIVIDQIAWSGTAGIYFRMLSGTTPATGGDYFWAYTGINILGTTSNSNGNAQTLGFLGSENNGANNLLIGNLSFDIFAPNTSQRTLFEGIGASVITDFASKSGIAIHNQLVAYTGIRLLTNSAVTMTGNVNIYGYRKA